MSSKNECFGHPRGPRVLRRAECATQGRQALKNREFSLNESRSTRPSLHRRWAGGRSPSDPRIPQGGRYRPVCGASWVLLGPSEIFWRLPWVSWGAQKPYCGVPGASWARLGASGCVLGRLGVVFGSSGGVQGPLRGVFGASWGVLRPLGRLLGASSFVFV